MRFFGRGQDNRVTGSYPSSSHAVWHVTHWPKRKQLMQKAHWIHGLGTAAWIWQGFCLSLCLELCHTSASSSELTGKICVRAGKPGDIWLISLWFFSELLLYFTSKSVFYRSLCNGDLSSIWRTSQWPEQCWCRWYNYQKTSEVLQLFSVIFSLPFISYWFSKSVWVNKQEDQ